MTIYIRGTKQKTSTITARCPHTAMSGILVSSLRTLIFTDVSKLLLRKIRDYTHIYVNTYTQVHISVYNIYTQ